MLDTGYTSTSHTANVYNDYKGAFGSVPSDLRITHVAMIMGDPYRTGKIQTAYFDAIKLTTELVQPEITITTDKTTYTTGDTMTISMDIANPTEKSVTFEWYIGVPQLDIWVTYASAPIPAGFNNSYTIPIPVGDWGPTPFGLVHYVHMLDPVSGDVLVQDAALCAYSPSVGKAMPVDIEEEIKKTIERVELPS